MADPWLATAAAGRAACQSLALLLLLLLAVQRCRLRRESIAVGLAIPSRCEGAPALPARRLQLLTVRRALQAEGALKVLHAAGPAAQALRAALPAVH